LGGDVSVIVKNSLFEHVSKSEWLQKQSCLNLTHSPPSSHFDMFFFLSWMKREVYKRVVDKQDDLLARILDVAADTRECEDKI